MLIRYNLPLFSTLPCLVSIVRSVVLRYFILQWGECKLILGANSEERSERCFLGCLGTLSSMFCREVDSDQFQGRRLDETRWGVARESGS
ncbi:hypothetical protein AVEN_216488-1 [Araneus ventricosus]|uniref:Uncharacterized protein n=1 Tax=Araneus ventricosus TaxID=182803 RepID=A0A4Y2BNF2_ARAVE|nr:hypothetical protein AVEN_216488-1 [Araneus ventricosus]